MKRRQFLQAGAATALGAPALAAPAIAQSAPEIKWRMTSSFSKSVETIYGTAQILCRYIAEATDNKFQIQAHAAGELARQPAGARRRHQRRRRVRAYAALSSMSARTPTLGFGSGLPFGLNSPPAAVRGGRSAAAARSSTPALKKLNAHGIPAGSTGAQMGAWFKKEINSARRPQGLAVPHRRAGRAGAGPRRRGAAHILRMPTSMRRWRTAPSMPPNSSAPTTTRSSASSEGGEVQLLTRAGGRAAAWCIWSSISRSGTRCPSPTRRSSRGPAMRPTRGCSPSTTRSIRRRSSGSSPPAPC